MKGKELKDHAVAPYNFISLPKKPIVAYNSMEELPKHNELRDDLLNGYVEFEIETKTPIIVARASKNSEKNFFENPEGKKAIPGNTIRGLVRTNAAILSKSNISDEIEDQRFFFRSFDISGTATDYKKRLQIKSIKENGINYSVAETVKAGFIYKRGKDDYVIVPSKSINGEQYFRISEQYLRLMAKNVKPNYMYNYRIKELIEQKNKYKNPKEKKFFLKNINNRDFKPYSREISFNVKEKRTVNKIDKRGILSNEGYLISSNFIGGKLAHYIIAEPNFNSLEFLELKNEKFKHIEFYEDDLIRSKKVKDNNEENFFTLPKKIGKENGKAIFYGEFKGNIYFGFTPYFRIPYDKSIKDGIAEEYKNSKGFSYIDGLFGFSNKGSKKLSYKSRLSFQDCIYEEGTIKNHKLNSEEYYDIVLGEPKASCFSNYLKQDEGVDPKNLNSYNGNEFEIKGIKNYWQKDYLDPIDSINKNMSRRIYPLKVGSIFKGKINFKNLRKDELGLILWALKVNEMATENIGLGKPYGFGRINISNINLQLEDLNKKYSSLSIDFYEKQDKNSYLDIYKKEIKKRFNLNIENELSVQELIKMKTVIIGEGKFNEGRYMTLADKEFTKKLPLLNPIKQGDIIEGKVIKSNAVKRVSSESKDKPFNRNKGKKDYNPNNKSREVYKDNCDNFGANQFDKLKNLFK